MPHRPGGIPDSIVPRGGQGDEDAGMVLQHIEAAKGPDREIHARVRLFFFGHISQMHLRLAPGSQNCVRHVPHRIVWQAV